MPFLKCLSEDADAFDVFAAFPQIHAPTAEVCEAIFRGDSPLSEGERQMLFAFASALNACQYCYGGHAAAAVAYGHDGAVFDALLNDIETAPVDDRLKPLFRLVRKMTLEHTKMVQCPSSKHSGLLSLFFTGGSGSSWFDVKPLVVDGSSGVFERSVF